MNHELNCIAKIAEVYDYPFSKPIAIDPKSLDFKTVGWCIELRKKTPSGAVSKRFGQTVIVLYCPFCGVKLTDD